MPEAGRIVALACPDHAARPASTIPQLAGVGLRYPHHRHVLEGRPAISWFEVHAENYAAEGLAARDLARIRQDYPVSLHATGLSLGSADGLDPLHVARVAALCDWLEPGLISDHLSWSRIDGIHYPDLLPLPYTAEALGIVVRNVLNLQDKLRRPILIENPSTYMRFVDSALSEGEFLGEIARRAGCGVLLDINNIAVSAGNAGEDPQRWLKDILDHVDAGSIGELHVAGHSEVSVGDHAILRIDDHGSPVSPGVWRLLEQALEKLGPRAVLVEWDTDIPTFETLEQQAALAQALIDATCRSARHAVTS